MPTCRITQKYALAVVMFALIAINMHANTTLLAISPNNAGGYNLDVGQYASFKITLPGTAPAYNVSVSYYQSNGISGNTPTYAASGNVLWLNITAYPSNSSIGIGIGSNVFNVNASTETGSWAFNAIISNSPENTMTANVPLVKIYPPLSISTNYNSSGFYFTAPFPVINLTYGKEYTINALNSTRISGGTGVYNFNWNFSGQGNSNGILLSPSCASDSHLCTVTYTSDNSYEEGTLDVAINDTSEGTPIYGAVQNIQYYFITASPTVPLSRDWLGRNITAVHAPRIGILIPSIGQIVYALGLGTDVVGMSSISESALAPFGIKENSSIANLGDYFEVPEFVPGLINSSSNYVPVDSGAFYSSLTSGISDMKEANITAVALGGDFDYNLTQVENDVMLVANTTGKTTKGLEVVQGMRSIAGNVTNSVASSPIQTVAMISYYDYGTMYVDGNQSFIGSEIRAAGGNDIYPGFYPSPSVSTLLSSNPDVIIASVFVDNITNTTQLLSSIPGINSTSAWKNGNVYVLGNLATNITDEPGPLAAYGTEIYGMILHPHDFGLSANEVPHGITSAWVEKYIKPSLFGFTDKHAKITLNAPASFEYNGTNATIAAYVYPKGLSGMLYISKDGSPYSLVASTTASSNSISYKVPAAAGAYSIKFASEPNATYPENVTFANYTIYKATPYLNFTSECGSYMYDGMGCTTVAAIGTYMNQLSAEMYLNGTIMGSSSNSISYRSPAAVNTYEFELNTPGNANYTAKSISYTYYIMPYVPPPSSSSGAVGESQKPNSNQSSSASNATMRETVILRPTMDELINYSKGHLLLTITSISANSSAHVVVISSPNKTLLPKAPSGYRLIYAVNLSVSNPDTTTQYAYLLYNCSENASRLYPYLIVNGTWKEINNYSVEPAQCRISFEVPPDPVIGLLYASPTTNNTQKNSDHVNATTTSTPYTTSIANITQLTTAPVGEATPKSASQKNETSAYAIIAIVLILIAIAAYLLATAHKRTKKR
jgi:iron complex transport system substrate-binding protein